MTQSVYLIESSFIYTTCAHKSGHNSESRKNKIKSIQILITDVWAAIFVTIFTPAKEIMTFYLYF